MKEKKISISKLSSARNRGRWQGRGSDWATPKELFDEIDKEFHFTLDVCASDWNKKCERYFSEKENGLAQDWGKEICFMNPPYGKEIEKWMEKAYTSALKGATIVCLVPAATDTKWWHEYAMKGEIRFLRGRPRFETPDGKWQQTFSPSVLVIFNEYTMCNCRYKVAKHYLTCVHNKKCKKHEVGDNLLDNNT